MKKTLVINDLNQLKSISDPFRLKLLTLLSESPKTGQMLADDLAVPRSKVHYHIDQLLHHNIIILAHTEEKNSIVQKFYSPAAKQIILAEDILNY